MGVHGERLYGQIDRVPGVCYVSTKFYHGNYVPFFPMQTFIVFEGSEAKDRFRGKAVPLNFKSVVIGYLRGWLGGVALFLAAGCCMITSSWFLGHLNGPAALWGIGSVGIVSALIWFVLTTHSRLFLPVQALLHAASLAILVGYLLVVAPNPAPRQARPSEWFYWPGLAIANLALIGYSVTRRWTNASYERGVELIDQLGLMPEETADDENLESQLAGDELATR